MRVLEVVGEVSTVCENRLFRVSRASLEFPIYDILRRPLLFNLIRYVVVGSK